MSHAHTNTPRIVINSQKHNIINNIIIIKYRHLLDSSTGGR